MKRRKVTRPGFAAAAARVERPWGDKSSLFHAALAELSPNDIIQAWNDLLIYGTAMIWRPAKGKPVLVPPMELLIAKQTISIPSGNWRALNEAKPKRGRK